MIIKPGSHFPYPVVVLDNSGKEIRHVVEVDTEQGKVWVLNYIGGKLDTTNVGLDGKPVPRLKVIKVPTPIHFIDVALWDTIQHIVRAVNRSNENIEQLARAFNKVAREIGCEDKISVGIRTRKKPPYTVEDFKRMIGSATASACRAQTVSGVRTGSNKDRLRQPEPRGTIDRNRKGRHD